MKTRIIIMVLWALGLLSLLFFPMKNIIIPNWGGFHGWDKVAHFGLFGVTSFVNLFGTGFFNRFRDRMLFGLIFGLVLALGTEVGQSVIPYRTISLYDFLADLAGLLLGLLFYILLYGNKKLRSRLKL